jgi:hypothetical protein
VEDVVEKHVIPLSSHLHLICPPECRVPSSSSHERGAHRILFSLELRATKPLIREQQPKMSSTSAALLQAILDNPQYHDYLAVLKGARNGLVYGFKVRFPHALIMAILFGRGEYVVFFHIPSIHSRRT